MNDLRFQIHLAFMQDVKHYPWILGLLEQVPAMTRQKRNFCDYPTFMNMRRGILWHSDHKDSDGTPHFHRTAGIVEIGQQ